MQDQGHQSQYIYWFNELFNVNLKFKNIKSKYEKDEDKLKSHVFDVLSEE